MKIPPKKSLGQHFLMNPSTIDKILEKAGVTAADQILEIGPGPGLMTERLARRARRTAVSLRRSAKNSPMRRTAGSLKETSCRSNWTKPSLKTRENGR